MEQITEISIKEISLSGFRNQKELVSFALGDVNCVTGHNGTGKTTLAHAVAFAFYGVTYFGEQKADRLINSESAGCEVKVDFSDQNGVLHSLIRRRFGSKTELIFDSFSVRQEEINRFICDKDTFLCIFNPFYLTSFGEARGRELIFRNLKTVGNDSILAAISDGFKKPLEGISITEPGVMLSFYRAGIRRCDEQIKIAEAKRATLRETVQANDAECDRLNEQAEVSAATVHILKEKQFSGLDLNSFRQRRSELTEQLKSTLESPVAVKAAALTEKLNNAREREYASKLSGEIAKLDAEISALKNTYSALKAKLLSLKPGEKCPTCSVILTDDLFTSARADISSEMRRTVQAAEGLKATRAELLETEQKSKDTFLQFKKDDIERLTAELDELKRTDGSSPEIIQKEIEEIDMLLSRGLLSDEEYSELCAEEQALAALEAQIKKLREYSVNGKIRELDGEIAAFEAEKRKYADITASLEEYISKRSELLSRELKMPNVSVTLFEPVKTTGELKSVFRFAYKGRDFAALSLSERTAAGLEICALMRRLTGLNFPVFIDNTESVANFDMSALPRQTVFLRMVKNAPLSVKSMNQATEPLKKAS
jgi:DNA repair exonuclease SbcCD ATPase subunit